MNTNCTNQYNWLYLRLLLTVLVVLMGSSAISHGQDGSNTVLVANFVSGNNLAFNSRVYLFNPSQSAGNVTVRVFTLPVSGGTAQELTASPLNLGSLGANSAMNIKLAEDILAPLGITLPYTDNDGDLTLEFTIGAANVRGATQVFSSSLAFGTYPLQEIPSTSSGSPTVLVANFTNGNDAAFNSRVYLFNPSPSTGNVNVRVFTLPLAGGTVQELTGTPLDLGTLGARAALNVRLAEDILTPLGITTPYITDGGNLTLEFTIEAADVRGAAQVFSSSFAFGVYPMQEIPSTSSRSATVLVANFMNGNSDALNSRVYLWNPSASAGEVTVRVFSLPLSSGTSQELTTTPFSLGSLEAKSALNIKLVEDILLPLGFPLPYLTDGGNLTLEITIQAADVVGAAQVFSPGFAFGTYPLPGSGDGTFQFQQTFPAGDGPGSLAAADLNADGAPDLVTANRFSDNVSVLLGNGDGTFQAQQTFPVGNFPVSVAVADLNTDGVPDLVTANANSDNVSVLLGNGDGTFQAQQTFPVGDEPQSVAAADLNADGAPDLVTANQVSDNVSVLLHQ